MAASSFPSRRLGSRAGSFPCSSSLQRRFGSIVCVSSTARLLVGPEWRDTGFVFTSGIGTPVDPANLLDDFKRILKKAGLPSIRFHDLRHSAASMLLALNVHPRVVMELLGHSQISLTMNTYSHVVPDLLREAVGKLGAALK